MSAWGKLQQIAVFDTTPALLITPGDQGQLDSEQRTTYPSPKPLRIQLRYESSFKGQAEASPFVPQ